jgi:hypothetical protein
MTMNPSNNFKGKFKTLNGKTVNSKINQPPPMKRFKEQKRRIGGPLNNWIDWRTRAVNFFKKTRNWRSSELKMILKPSKRKLTKKGKEAWGLRNMRKESIMSMKETWKNRRARHRKSKEIKSTMIPRTLIPSNRSETFFESLKQKNSWRKKHYRMQIERLNKLSFRISSLMQKPRMMKRKLGKNSINSRR